MTFNVQGAKVRASTTQQKGLASPITSVNVVKRNSRNDVPKKKRYRLHNTVHTQRWDSSSQAAGYAPSPVSVPPPPECSTRCFRWRGWRLVITSGAEVSSSRVAIRIRMMERLMNIILKPACANKVKIIRWHIFCLFFGSRN